MKYYISIRDVTSFKDCKPLQTSFYFEGLQFNLKIVYDALLLKFPSPRYLIEIDKEETNFVPVNTKDW